jgi:hypothetical protein
LLLDRDQALDLLQLPGREIGLGPFRAARHVGLGAGRYQAIALAVQRRAGIRLEGRCPGLGGGQQKGCDEICQAHAHSSTSCDRTFASYIFMAAEPSLRNAGMILRQRPE